MTSRGESARRIIRSRAANETVVGSSPASNITRSKVKSRGASDVATGIDVTSSNAITFGYVSELARPGRVIAGRHRLQAPLNPASARSAPAAATGCYGSSLWRADSLRCGRPVLVELLDPAIAEDASLADLFAAEARAASAVTSPFVCQVLDFGVEISTPYLVTELPHGSGGAAELDLGETLAARIAGGHRPSFGEFARSFGDLCQAVEAMHCRDLLHRDLRSERVALLRASFGAGGERETVKLSFGISKLMNDTLELVRTMARRAVVPAATPAYACPEQVLGTATLGPACDVWSLAVIAFEWVTGELPFIGSTVGDRLVQICAGPARVPSQLMPSLPRGFDAWFARGVQKGPEDRWPSVRAMADALRELAPARAR